MPLILEDQVETTTEHGIELAGMILVVGPISSEILVIHFPCSFPA